MGDHPDGRERSGTAPGAYQCVEYALGEKLVEHASWCAEGIWGEWRVMTKREGTSGGEGESLAVVRYKFIPSIELFGQCWI